MDKPRISKDGIVFSRTPRDEPGEIPKDQPTATHTRQESDEWDSLIGQDSTGEGKGPRKRLSTARRRTLIAVAVVAVVLVGWMVADRLLDQTGGLGPVEGSHSTNADTTDAEKVALKYETAVLAGETKSACSFEEDPAYCERIMGTNAPVLETSAAPKVVKAEAVQLTNGQTGDETSGTAVLVEFTIKDQPGAQREAVFVIDSKVVGTENVGSEDADSTLQDLFEEDAS